MGYIFFSIAWLCFPSNCNLGGVLFFGITSLTAMVEPAYGRAWAIEHSWKRWQHQYPIVNPSIQRRSHSNFLIFPNTGNRYLHEKTKRLEERSKAQEGILNYLLRFSSSSWSSSWSSPWHTPKIPTKRIPIGIRSVGKYSGCHHHHHHHHLQTSERVNAVIIFINPHFLWWCGRGVDRSLLS